MNSLFEKIKWSISDPVIRSGYLDRLGFYKRLSDEKYLKKKFFLSMGYPLNLDNPQTFNEKIQWLKLYDRCPEYTMMVDKYAVREYIAKKIGKEYLIPLLGVWDSPDDIDFESLPNQFVLKCNHNSGLGLCICKNKSELDIKKVKRGLKRGLGQDYYLHGREWPYKNVPRKIVCEKYMTDESGVEPKDYKIFNFDGEPKIIEVDYDRFVEHKRNLYTIDWQYIEAEIQYPADPDYHIERPERLEKMLGLARILSEGFSHVRTDFYCIDDHIYFGELTFYHGSGFEKFRPEKFGKEMGKWIKLPPGGRTY